MINYYEVLEVSEKASKEVIEKAYKELAKKYHPDLNQDNRKEAELKMKEINEAFEILMDDSKRSNFDRVLEKKRQIEKQKEFYTNKQSSNSQNINTTQSINTEKNFGDNSTISYYTDKNDNFYVNTANMDERTKRKIQHKMQERYLEAYDAYLRERGYKLKYKWTFKRVMQLVLIIVISILVLILLFFIPPIHEFCIDLYEENIAVHAIVNLVRAIFDSIVSIFK